MYWLLELRGMPPPPRANSDTDTIRPLSKEVMDMLDPTTYMSLWELQSSMKNVTEGKPCSYTKLLRCPCLKTPTLTLSAHPV